MIAAGLPLVIVQPGAVYGPGDTSALRGVFVSHLRRRLPFVPARTAYSWGHIEDTAHAHVEAMEQGAARAQLHHRRPGPHPARRAAHGRRGSAAAPRRSLAVPPRLLKGGRRRVLRVVESAMPLPPSLVLRDAGGAGRRHLPGIVRQGPPRAGLRAAPLEEGLRHLVEYEMRQLGLVAPG